MHTGRVHEIEVHEVVDAELLELKHDRAEVTAKDLGVRLLLHLRLVRLLRVQPEALAGARATCTTRTLLRARLTDRRDQQRLDADTRVVHFLLREAGIDHKHHTV